VRILGVEAGTAAREAGLEEQDVLLSANGGAIHTLDDLQRVLVLSRPTEIGLEVLRHGERRRLVIQPRSLAA